VKLCSTLDHRNVSEVAALTDDAARDAYWMRGSNTVTSQHSLSVSTSTLEDVGTYRSQEVRVSGMSRWRPHYADAMKPRELAPRTRWRRLDLSIPR
jgi:hypothetical protein